MCLTLQQGQILCPRLSSHFISSLRPGSDFHQIIESSSLQTKRVRLLLKYLLSSWTFHWLTVPTFRRGPNYIFNQWQLRFSYLLNTFLLAIVLTNEISSFLYINQLGSISTSFWQYTLKSVRWKALGWISYFTTSSSSVPPNVFSDL